MDLVVRHDTADDLAHHVVAVRLRLARIELDLAEIKARIGDLERRISAIEVRLGVGEGRLSAIEQTLERLDARVARLEQDMVTKAFLVESVDGKFHRYEVRLYRRRIPSGREGAYGYRRPAVDLGKGCDRSP